MTADNKKARAENLKTFKRRHILEAARRLFVAAGLDGLNMRDIAAEAGYSLGAAYAYFSTKEEIHAELLALVLADLNRHIRTSLTQEKTSRSKARIGLSIFYRYFRDHPKDRQLYLSVFANTPTTEPDLDPATAKELNSKLLGLLGFLANTMHQESALSASDAQSETLDAVTYLSGLLMLEASGRLDLMNQNPQEMVDRYMDRMLLRTEQ